MGTATAKTNVLFETMPVPKALFQMAIPTIMSQLITVIYNVADTWFIGQTDNPYMVAASSLVLTIFLMTTAIGALFGTGGGSLVVRLLGKKEEEEARKVASLSLLMAGGTEVEIKAADEFAMNLGTAFQIRDDILDVIADEEELGKPVGSDEENDKNTYVKLLGLEKSKELVEQYSIKAKEALDVFGDRAEFLRKLADYLINRTN